MAIINGTSAANVLNGTAVDDQVNGLAGNDTLNGLGGNDTLDGGTGNDTMAGGIGNDTYIVDSISDVVTEAASAGTDTVRSSVTWTLGVNLENLVLTGTAAINGTGNTLNNVITGNSAANILNGGLGNDTMIGGLGNDTYVVNVATDIVTEAASAGTDTVQSAVTLATLALNVENLTLTGTAAINGTGNTLANVLTGNTANNILNGGSGNDTLNGGLGNDTMIGGLGDDTYVVNVATDIVTEAASQGIDTVQSAVTYTLGTNVENLLLTGTAAINGTGNTLANVITGNTGNNVLSGLGGNDTMVGGLGNDTYVVDATGDVVTEAASAGTDLVQSSATFTLGLNVENLTLTGGSSINGTGNTLANVITGNGGNNVLNGGAGNDTLIGGLGNDTYVVDTLGDIVTEAASAGIDTVQAGITYSIAALTNVENLTLTGTAAIDGTGNAGNNVISGNANENLLSGGAGLDLITGKEGDDVLVGGAGNDTLGGDQGNDNLLGGADNDILFGGADDDLLAGETGNDTLDGGTGSDMLIGSVGDDILNGGDSNDDLLGGADNDTLDGGADSDTLLGDAGTDTLNGGDGNDNLMGGADNDILFGGADDDLLSGDAGNDTLDGGANDDLLAGGTGNDTLDGGAGEDILVGQGGNDTLVWDAADVITNGGADFDTLQLNGALQTLDLATVPNGKIQGIEIINITGSGNNTLVLNAAAVLALNGAGTLRVNGDVGDTVVAGDNGIFNDWAAVGTTSIDSVTYNVFNKGAATLQVQAGVSTPGFPGPGNDPPYSADKTVTITEDTPFEGHSVLHFDPDGNGFAGVRIDSLPEAGSLLRPEVIDIGFGLEITVYDDAEVGDILTANEFADLRFTPDPNGNGAGYASFDFSVRSSTGEFSSAPSYTFTYNVTAVNDAPTVTGLAVPITEAADAAAQDIAGSGTVSFNDVDAGALIDLACVSNGDIALSGGTIDSGLAAALVAGFSVTTVTDGAAPGSTPWTYAANDVDLDFLEEGQTITWSYTVTATDEHGATGDDIVLFTITGTNEAPVAVADANGTDVVIEAGDGEAGDATAVGDVLANDTDADSLAESLAVTAVNGSLVNVGNPVAGNYGSVTILADGSYTYTLSDGNLATGALTEGAAVTDVFSYTVTDEHGATSTASLAIAITGSNDAPVAVANDNTSAPDPVIEAGHGEAGDATAAGNVLTNDTDVDTPAASLAVIAVYGFGGFVGGPVASTYGFVTINADGSYTYTLNDGNPATSALTEGQVVTDVINYTVEDDFGGQTAANLTITITGSNDAPVAVNDALVATVDTPVSYAATDLLGNDTDVDNLNGDLSIVSVTSGTGGTAVLELDGTVTFTPNAGFDGAADFTYVVSDGNGATDSGSVTVDVGVTFTGTLGNDTADAVAGTLSGFTGGTLAQLQDGFGDTFNGGDGNDVVIAGSGDDTLSGEDGNDTLTGGGGNDSLDGGDGDEDLADYSATTAGIQVNLEAFSNQATGAEIGTDQLVNFENVRGGSGNDTLIGDSISTGFHRNVLEGGDGNDTLTGGADSNMAALGDILDGDGGIDTVDYSMTTSGVIVDLAEFIQPSITFGRGRGAEIGVDFLLDVETVLGGSGNDDFKSQFSGATFYGNDGNDSFLTPYGGVSGTTVFDGGNGIDSASFYSALELGSIVLTLDADGYGLFSTAGYGTVTVLGMENLTGGASADTLTGNGGANTLAGGNGNDILDGGAGNDTLDGENGLDTASYAWTTLGVTVNLGAGSNQGIGVESGGDQLLNIERVTGGSGSDSITGNSLANVLNGGEGADGISGGDGADTLIGGDDNDTLTGGVGADSFRFGPDFGFGSDTVTDFVTTAANGAVHDRIDLTGLGQTFSSLTIVYAADATITLDGGDPGDEIVLTGVTGGLQASDFIFGASGAGVAFLGTTGGDTADAVGGTLSGFTGGTLAQLQDGFGDTFNGGDGNDVVIAGSGDDTLSGEDGNDTLTGGGGNDSLDGGDGDEDLADYSATTAGIQVNLEAFSNQATGAEIGTDQLVNFENVRGGSGNDTLIGDSISTGFHRNVLEGGDGNDTLTGGADSNMAALGDILDGDGGIDTVDYSMTTSGVIVDLAEFIQPSITFGRGRGAEIGVDFLLDVETVLGGSGNDDFKSQFSGATFYGNDGNDSFLTPYGGVSGTTVFDGGNGIDSASFYSALELGSIVLTLDADGYGLFSTAGYGTVTVLGMENLTGGASADTLTGNGGANTLAGGNGNDILDGGAGNDTLDGENGLDTASYAWTTLGVTVNLGAGSNQGIGVESGGDQLLNIERVTGGSGSDSITGNSLANVLNGGEGADGISGGDGADTLIGGDDNDTLTGGVGADSFRFGPDFGFGSDTVTDFVTTAANGAVHDRIDLTGLGQTFSSLTIVYAADATITLDGGDPGDEIVLTGVTGGLQASDFIFGASGAGVAFLGTTGGDTADAVGGTLSGFTGGTLAQLQDGFGDTFNGGDGNDVVIAGSGDDTLSGEDGNDTLTGGGGNDSLDGGDGDEDLADYSATTAGIQVNLEAFSNQATGAEIGTDQLVNFENVRGGSGNDTLIGDSISTGFHRNVLEGGDGNDTLTGGADSNMAALGDILDGDGGIDTVDYSMTTSGVIVDLAEFIQPSITFGRGRGAEIGVDFLLDVETVLGGSGNDDFKSQFSGATFYGNDGNDNFLTPYGGVSGTTVFDGGNGIDSASFYSALELGSIVLTLDADGYGLFSTAGYGTVTVLGMENLTGGAAADTLTGNGGANTLAGGNGNDILDGGAGNDTLDGEGGADDLTGGTGADTIQAGADSNVDEILYTAVNEGAAPGQNTGYDTIAGFVQGDDSIKFVDVADAAIDDSTINGTLAFVTDAATNFSVGSATEAMLLTFIGSGLADSALLEEDFTTLIGAINAEGVTAISGNDGLIVAQGTSDTGIYYYLESGTDNQVNTGELTLLAIVDNALLDQTNFTAVSV